MQGGEKQIKAPRRAVCAPEGDNFSQRSSLCCVAQHAQYRHGSLALCCRKCLFSTWIKWHKNLTQPVSVNNQCPITL